MVLKNKFYNIDFNKNINITDNNNNLISKIDETLKNFPGLKILKSVKQLSSIPRAFHIDFPDELVAEILEDQDHVQEIGINWAIKQAQELLDKGAPSVHFYVMNDASSVIKVMKALNI